MRVASATVVLVLGALLGGATPAAADRAADGTPRGGVTQAGVPASLTIDPGTVVAGSGAVGTVTLAAVATADTEVALSSTNPGVVSVPPGMTVPAGALSATFPVTTVAFSGSGEFGCVFGRAGGAEVVGCVNVNPAPSGPVLTSVSVTPATVVGGGPATGTVGFASPTDGAVVALGSSDPAVVQVPAETVVSGGASTGTFPVTTAAVTTTRTVTITATAFGVTRTGTLTVTPGTPPAADTVRITRAEWDRGRLRISATSTNPDAILGVYLTASDSFMFTLTNLGNGRYEAQRAWLDDPRRITVRSNFGGSATADVR
ncbi:MAG TPA: hypothetical protein VGD67_04165 [Pseudonocardiaceae bacterium]